MNKLCRLIFSVLLICAMLLSFAACDQGGNGETETEAGDGPTDNHVDYADKLKLDMNSPTLKQEVTVKLYIDGDTTHFYFPGGSFEDGVMKARYIAINTPESTGRIEEWGKKASNFTKEKLQNATSIIVESDNDKWNADSTGGRYLVWVWYRTSENEDYRNLNVEILQNGLAIASKSANNRYGDTCMAAIEQAKAEKLFVHSKEKDPDFPYGGAQELTLKELRCNVASYDNAKVAFEGVIISVDSGSCYVEDFDAETGLYYGMTIYFETAGLPGKALAMLDIGNRVRFCGTVTAFQGMWQVSGLTYSLMQPNHPENVNLLSEGNSAAYVLTDAATFTSDVTITVDEEIRTYKYADLTLYTSIEMKNLRVKDDIYTTQKGDNKGAMTLHCVTEDGIEIDVRTAVLYDDQGNLVTDEYFKNATIDVKGMVDLYSYDGANDYQIKVFSLNDVTIHK